MSFLIDDLLSDKIQYFTCLWIMFVTDLLSEDTSNWRIMNRLYFLNSLKIFLLLCVLIHVIIRISSMFFLKNQFLSSGLLFLHLLCSMTPMSSENFFWSSVSFHRIINLKWLDNISKLKWDLLIIRCLFVGYSELFSFSASSLERLNKACFPGKGNWNIMKVLVPFEKIQ